LAKKPEEWLELVSPRPTRGDFKLFLGTLRRRQTYSMLSEASGAKPREDVVIGIIETHGRKGIQELAAQLEAVPARNRLQGTPFQEMDIDAILAAPRRRLVDELATQHPGSRHRKRYEDVQELLAAKIDVVPRSTSSTSKASLPLRAITGVTVRETVPTGFRSAQAKP